VACAVAVPAQIGDLAFGGGCGSSSSKVVSCQNRMMPTINRPMSVIYTPYLPSYVNRRSASVKLYIIILQVILPEGRIPLPY
jgi:hypothetical protein